MEKTDLLLEFMSVLVQRSERLKTELSQTEELIQNVKSLIGATGYKPFDSMLGESSIDQKRHRYCTLDELCHNFNRRFDEVFNDGKPIEIPFSFFLDGREDELYDGGRQYLNVCIGDNRVHFNVVIYANENKQPMTENQRIYLESFNTEKEKIEPWSIDKDTAIKLLALLSEFEEFFKLDKISLKIDTHARRNYKRVPNDEQK